MPGWIIRLIIRIMPAGPMVGGADDDPGVANGSGSSSLEPIAMASSSPMVAAVGRERRFAAKACRNPNLRFSANLVQAGDTNPAVLSPRHGDYKLKSHGVYKLKVFRHTRLKLRIMLWRARH